jgi:hypothetical protein
VSFCDPLRHHAFHCHVPALSLKPANLQLPRCNGSTHLFQITCGAGRFSRRRGEPAQEVIEQFLDEPLPHEPRIALGSQPQEGAIESDEQEADQRRGAAGDPFARSSPMAKPQQRPCRTRYGSRIVGILWRTPAEPSLMPSENRCVRCAPSSARPRSIPSCSQPPSASSMRAICAARRLMQPS